MNSLEQRIEKLEAKDAIRELKALYCEICDDGHNPYRMVGIFTEDGIWESEGFAKAEGHEQIRQLFDGFGPAVSLSHHIGVNPIIEVNGNTATGKWYFMGMFKFAQNDERKWMAGHYQETYVKTVDGWKIKHLYAPVPLIDASYEAGW